jgi:hypothetical protein
MLIQSKKNPVNNREQICLVIRDAFLADHPEGLHLNNFLSPLPLPFFICYISQKENFEGMNTKWYASR